MKNPKTLYIAIGAFCILAVIVGIYAQFFSKTNTNNLNTTNTNQTDDDQVAQKTMDELKSQFASLFTNVLNDTNYDTSKINRIDKNKNIIYSAYDINEKKENYEVNIHLPVINIIGDVPVSFNNITQSIFANKASEILSNKVPERVVYQVNYVAYINGDILSLIIEGTLKQGDKPQRIIVQSYNYNLVTGEKVEVEDILAQKNLILSEVQNKINTTVQKEKEKAEVLVQSGYSVYSRDLSDHMYEIGNLSTFFLGPNGNLYIVFPYGNQNYTSEMDIVFYE